MKTSRLIEDLRRPEAYPHEAERFEVRHTHISVVFLAGEYAYKVKKPLDLGFLDFTSLERRLHFCREEVRLNRRLAPDVYLGVVPLTLGPDGVQVDGQGEVVEWAVRMRRLPPDATLRERLLRGRLDPGVVEKLARRIAEFHARAASGPEISRFGRWKVVAENARDNLVEARSHVGVTLSPEVHRRLERALEEWLGELRPLIEERARRHVPRDTHGDLHLDHVYLFLDRAPPSDLVVVDCIEFSERFRRADPVSDMAFLAMDLIRHGRRDLEERFSDAYFRASGDGEGRTLLPFYRSYRAAVRGKVEGLAAVEDDVPPKEREASAEEARAHWLLALSELEPPARRPGLVLVGGLPGSGKSTVADGLRRAAGFRTISSDRIRKALAGLEPEASGRGNGFEEGLYTRDWTERTYAECLGEAREALHRGERVIVDATFRSEEKRERFLTQAWKDGVRSLLLICTADPHTIRERLAARVGGASDADWHIYREVAARWEEPAAETRRSLVEVGTEGSQESAVASALEHLRRFGLAG